MNRDNQPVYNVNRKVANFGDFCDNIDAEKEELKKMKRQTTPNSAERQQVIGNKKFKFNKVTRKMDDLSQDEINDKIDNIEELKESLQEDNRVVYEAEVTEDLIEDDGDALIIYHLKNEDSNIAVTLTSYSEDGTEEENPDHDDIRSLIGHRVKITLEKLD